MNSMGNMFGTASAPPAINSMGIFEHAVHEAFDPEDNLDNPAFASEHSTEEEDVPEEYRQAAPQEQPEHREAPAQQTDSPQGETTGYFCDECGAEINERVYGYSLNKFGRPLCMKCQKGAGK